MQKAEASRNTGFNVTALEELEIAGKEIEESITVKPQPDRVFSTSFYDEVDGVPLGVRLTHQNLTAGPTAIRQFFTLTAPLGPNSTIYSAFPLASPFGRAIAYTALFEGCNFATLNSTSVVKESHTPSSQTLGEIVRAAASGEMPQPSHLFITPAHLDSITKTITAHNRSSFFGSLAWKRKNIELAGGSLSDSTFWDGLGGLTTARRVSFGYGKADPWLKSVVVAGGPCPERTFPISRVALSVPLINAHIEAISTAPILASHPFDLQHFPPSKPEEEVAHVGPPAANVEVKLTADSDPEVDQTLQDPVGKLLYRGPSIGERVPALPAGPVQGEWNDTGRRATVHSNGTFRVLN